MAGYVGYRYVASYAATNITISGKVVDQNGKAVAGVKIQTCATTTQPLSNSLGNYSFVVAKKGIFCSRILGYPANYSTGQALNNHTTHNTSATYEWQVAGFDCYSNKRCGTGKIGSNNGVLTWDRGIDTGYDFKVNYTAPSSATKIMWGIGDQIGDAPNTAIYKAASTSINMITGWFNTPNDLGWMAGYSNPANTQLSDIYGKGKAVELVVWQADGIAPNSPANPTPQNPPVTLPQYAITPAFLGNLRTLIDMYKGHGPNYGPLYVVMFTEHENYYKSWTDRVCTTLYPTWNDKTKPTYAAHLAACNTYRASVIPKATYDAALLNQYIAAAKQIRAQYPQAKVSLGFSGFSWTGALPTGIDLSKYTAAINASDFMAVQQMQSCLHEDLLPPQMKASVKQLGAYGKPVMISHFKIWNDGLPNSTAAQKIACAQSAYTKFQQEMFTEKSLAGLKADGLFAWDFMTDNYINDSGPNFETSKAFIKSHTLSSIGFPSP